MVDLTQTPLFGVPTQAHDASINTATEASAPVPGGITEKKKGRGVGGVASDVLGYLGDFLLTKLGMPAMYGPARKQKKLESAFSGFDADPIGAINRVTEVDYAAGTKLRDQFIVNQRLAASQASTQEARDARLELAATAQREKNRNTGASMLGALAGVSENDRAKNYAEIRKRLLNRYSSLDPQLAQDLPEEYDPVSIDAFVEGAVPVRVQRTQKLTAERIDATRDIAAQRDETTRRGQNITSGDKAASRSVTIRGQNISSQDKAENRKVTIRGQNIHGNLGKGNLKEKIRHNKVTEGKLKVGDVVTLPNGEKRILTK